MNTANSKQNADLLKEINKHDIWPNIPSTISLLTQAKVQVLPLVGATLTFPIY